MGKKRTIESYRDEFYQKFPDKTYIKFIEKIGNHLIVEDKFGICKIAQSHLMRGYFPTIRIALDKNSYFTNRLKSIHGDLYDASLINYTGLDNPITLICSKHGEFEITPHSITSQKAGCKKCSYEEASIRNGQNPTGWSDSDWYEKAKNSKHFDSFKTYLIKCWNENEQFYKIGKTFRTLKDRLVNHKERMPYNWELIDILELKELSLQSAKDVSEMERLLKNQNKEYKYVPMMNIRGKFECFKQIKY